MYMLMHLKLRRILLAFNSHNNKTVYKFDKWFETKSSVFAAFSYKGIGVLSDTYINLQCHSK